MPKSPNPKITRALVLAAGLGTRLRPLTWLTPKPLIPLWGTPLLAHTIRRLESWGVNQIHINTHWRPEAVAAFLARHKTKISTLVTTSHEPVILGTGGALRPLRDQLGDEPFWLVNADIAFSLDPAPLLKTFHANPCAACVWLLPNLGPRTVETDPSGRVTSWNSATPAAPNTSTLAGLHIVSPKIFDHLPADKTTYSILTPYQAADAAGLPVLGVAVEPSYWSDIGTPDALLAAHAEIKKRALLKQPGGEYYAPQFDVKAQDSTGKSQVSSGTAASPPQDLNLEPSLLNLEPFICFPAPPVPGLQNNHNTVILNTVPPTKPVANSILATKIPWPRGGSNLIAVDVEAQENLAPIAACQQLGWLPASCVHLGARGSEREFWRVAHHSESAIVVAYSGRRHENRRYASHARALREAGVHVPNVLLEIRRAHHDGILALQDLGNNTSLLHAVERQASHAAAFDRACQRAYQGALDATLRFHERVPLLTELDLEPAFDEQICAWERNLLEEHVFLRRGKSLLPPHIKAEYARVAARLMESPQTVIHRDLQSTNLLHKGKHWYFIDFQGMRRGPTVYDLASLLCDPYVELPAVNRSECLFYYASNYESSIQTRLIEDFHWGAVQRLTQAIAAYHRLAALGHAEFPRHIPAAARLLSHAAQSCGLPAIAEMAEGILAENTP